MLSVNMTILVGFSVHMLFYVSFPGHADKDAVRVESLLSSIPELRTIESGDIAQRKKVTAIYAEIDQYSTESIKAGLKRFLSTEISDKDKAKPLGKYQTIQHRRPRKAAAIGYVLSRYLFRVDAKHTNIKTSGDMDMSYQLPDRWPSGRWNWPWQIDSNERLFFAGRLSQVEISFFEGVDPTDDFLAACKYKRRRAK